MEDVDHDALIAARLLAAVELDGPDERAWLDCELASLAENRLDDRTDPGGIDDARRERWQSRAALERSTPLAKRAEFDRSYWLLEDGQRVGTCALGATSYGARDVRVSSLYVLPAHRGRGVGRRALERLGAMLAAQRHGYRLDTCWSWQRTVRFYLRAGLWVRMWKRDLTLCRGPTIPAPIIAFDAGTATLSVRRGTERVVLAGARRGDPWLLLDERAAAPARDPDVGEAYGYAVSTLALAVALEGWPLVRSTECWDNYSYADAGAPEALARKIAIWEAWDRDHGWRVETPRIPGLAYPTWAEFAARWEAESAALDTEGPKVEGTR